MESDRAGVLDGSLGMIRRPLSVLIVATHPVQYASPIFRLLAKDPRVGIQVVYCNLHSAKTDVDLDFGVEVKWDIPLLDGYSWFAMPNWSLNPRLGSFFGLINPQVWRLIWSGRFDAVVVYTGYVYLTFWIALVAAKLSRTPILFGTDAHDISPRDHNVWKTRLKKLLWPRLFRLADVVIVPSSAGVKLMSSLGVPENRVVLTPFCVNNKWWIEQSKKADRVKVRARWCVPQEAVVILFCAKLQSWKRPLDLLRAFATVTDRNTFLVFAGDGILRSVLQSEAEFLGIAERVRFLGFVNQSGLPETYTASDIMVLPSEYEPFGVVVNEAMLCGCCVIVSDHVGARFDLIREGESGFVFRAGDTESLAQLLNAIVSDRANLKRIGQVGSDRMTTWSPLVNVDKTIEAIQRSTTGKFSISDGEPTGI